MLLIYLYNTKISNAFSFGITVSFGNYFVALQLVLTLQLVLAFINAIPTTTYFKGPFLWRTFYTKVRPQWQTF